MKLDDRLLEAARSREIWAEHNINLIRAVGFIGAALIDSLILVDKMHPSRAEEIAGGVAIALLAGYCVVIHLLTRSEVYRPWLKYLTIAVDYLLILVVYLEFRRIGFPPELPGVALATHIGAWFLVVNFLSAFRAGRAVIVYSTALGVGFTAALGLLFDDPATTIVYPVFLMMVSGACVWFLSRTTERLFLGLRRKEQLMRFLSRELVRSVEAGEVDLALGGSEREVTILLTDIRGFTSLSETRSPTEVVELLNEHFTAMTEIVFAHGGVVDKYIGDALLGVFGAPVAAADHALRAARAAVAMLARVDAMNEEWRRRGREPIAIGIALHTGPVVAGNVGNPDRMEYTVIGDTVNTASRVESLNKQYGTRLLLTESTRRAIGDEIATRFVAEAEIRGRARPIRLHGVEGASWR